MHNLFLHAASHIPFQNFHGALQMGRFFKQRNTFHRVNELQVVCAEPAERWHALTALTAQGRDAVWVNQLCSISVFCIPCKAGVQDTCPATAQHRSVVKAHEDGHARGLKLPADLACGTEVVKQGNYLCPTL